MSYAAAGDRRDFVTMSNDTTVTESFCILLAEDNIELSRLLAWALQRRGCEVVRCHDGRELEERLHPSHPVRYDLVLTDVRMPGANGLDALTRAQIGNALPPVIVMSAFADETVLDTAALLGVARVFSKPFDIDELVDAVLETLARAPASKAPPAEPAELRSSPAPQFLVHAAVRGEADKGPIEAFVYEAAAALNPFHEAISHCRVSIAGELHGGKRHGVHIEVVLRGKHPPLEHHHRGTHQDPYAAISSAFKQTRHQLSRLLKRGPRHAAARHKVA
jgi:CheY-like chemotaxis protein/ribosome-associated translation inhibitor RaiA